LKYLPEILKTLPEEVLAFYCCVGNPFSLGAVARGDAVLDVGCGAGVDSLVAAMVADQVLRGDMPVDRETLVRERHK